MPFISGVKDKYPAELLENRLTIEGNVVASIMKDLLLLDEIKITSKDFISKDGHFLFSLAKSIRDKGYAVFDEVAVKSSCSEAVYEKLESVGGFETVRHMIDVIDTQNFNVYIDTFYRENIILRLHREGFPLLKDTDTKQGKMKIYELFRKMTAEQVIDWYDAKLSEMPITSTSLVLEDEYLDFDDEFLDSCSEGEENGVPFTDFGDDINGDTINCYPFLSGQINGLIHGGLSIMSGFSSAGKSTWVIAMIMALVKAGEKCIIITNEEKIKAFKSKMLVWLLARYNRYFNLTKKKLLSGDITDEDRVEIHKARKYFRDNYNKCIRIVSIADADMGVVKQLVRDAALKDGFTAFFYDTFKISEGDMDAARTDLMVVRDTRELHKLARKYDMIGICAMQLGERYKGRLFLTAEVLSNSKQTKEQAENMFMMRPMINSIELDSKSKYFCKPFRAVKKDGKWIEEDYHLDPTKTYRILFVEKARCGENSGDNGKAYVYQFNGNFALFKEVCQCRPVHGEIK